MNRPLWLIVFRARWRLREEKHWRMIVAAGVNADTVHAMRKRLTKAQRITLNAINDNLMYGNAGGLSRLLKDFRDADGN